MYVYKLMYYKSSIVKNSGQFIKILSEKMSKLLYKVLTLKEKFMNYYYWSLLIVEK